MTQQTSHTPCAAWIKQERQKNAVELADSILKAAGSGLRNYSLSETRNSILSAANAGIDSAQAELLEALERLQTQMFNLLLIAGDSVPERFAASFNDGQKQASAAIAKARGQS